MKRRQFFGVLGAGAACASAPDAELPPVRAITRPPGYHWFGYYDKWQFSPDGRFVLGMRTGFENRSPRAEDVIRVGTIDLASGDEWTGIGVSRAWAWQNGCMLQYLPGGSHEIVWNDRDNGRFVARIHDPGTGRTRTLPGPVYALTPDSRSSIAPDFSRLAECRPGYGYAGIPDPNRNVLAPENSGLWKMDLRSGETKLLISFARAASIPHPGSDLKTAKHWFNHPSIAPGGERFVFVHRWRPKGAGSGPYTTRLITADLDGGDLHVLEEHGKTSHFAWLDSERLTAWAWQPSQGWKFYTFTDRSRKVEVLASGVMTENGHISYLPDRDWVVNDTSPDKQRIQHLYLYNVKTGRRYWLGHFPSPPEYTGEWRCDLHPRFSRDGRKIVIDSAHGGNGRQMYLLDISGIVGKPPVPRTQSGSAAPLRGKAAPVDYLAIVQAYADTMLEHGRDVYGPVHSPLFAASLDRRTLRLPATAPPAIPGIREGDRCLAGANPMHDQNLYQVLYALTGITGQRRYADAADEALRWFFEHAQSPATGLFAWGEHLGWNFLTEAVLGRDQHEFYRPWVLWEKSIQLAPDSCRKFAVGLWRHQIAGHQTGEFSRHSRYSAHEPGRGYEFPRHGGFYIAIWAGAYQRWKEPELLTAIERLLASFEARRHPRSGALPAYTKALDIWWPQSELSLAIDLWNASQMAPPELAATMRAAASRIDASFLKAPHDLGPNGKGFVLRASTPTLQATEFTQAWSTGYGMKTDAQYAMMCLLRYEQVKRSAYKDLFLAAAGRYLAGEAGAADASAVLYPGAVGDVIFALMGAYRLTGGRKYLDRAEHVGRQAVEPFFQGSPLPRASTNHDHYEAITRADTLVMALLDLDSELRRRDSRPRLVYTDR